MATVLVGVIPLYDLGKQRFYGYSKEESTCKKGSTSEESK
jgi:hypothetical protein